MDYLITVLLVGAAQYYVTELLTAPWRVRPLLKTAIDAFIAIPAALWIYPHIALAPVMLLAGNLVASLLRVAVDAVTSKPQTITRQRNY